MNRMKRFNYTFILLPFLACWLLLASCGGMKDLDAAMLAALKQTNEFVQIGRAHV